MKFEKVAGYLDRLEATSSRIEITKILADLFKQSDEEEIDKVVYLILGTLAASYEEVVFNIAEKMMQRSIADAYGVDVKKVKDIYKQKGDLGEVAYSLSDKAKSKKGSMSVTGVYELLREIAQDEGEGSQERKVLKTSELLKKSDALSAKFLARIEVGKLRLGFSDKTILDALSWMKYGDKSAKAKLDGAYQVLPDVGLLARHVKKLGIDKATKDITPQVGIPVLPMLAQRLKKPSEMIEKMHEVAIEPKLDGLRIQIHFKSGKDGFVKAFTRNLNETSWMFPELKNAGKYISAREVILDSEAVGVDEVTKKLANFQTTMTRRRKHEVAKHASNLPIRFFVFDVLVKDGKSYMNKDYLQRRSVLEKTVKKSKLLEIVDNIITKDPNEVSRLNKSERKEGFEGIMLKKVTSKYVPGRTGWRWVKMKESEEATGKLADTVDCVVMGFSAGKGKRASFGVGQFLVGVTDGRKIKTVSKIGTGLTDEQFKELDRRLKNLQVEDKPKEYDVTKNYIPDTWVRSSLVVEIAADDITKSPSHTAGLALRFPRLVKFRDDKSPEQATTKGEVEKLYKLQFV
jgi:DNA ligase-1